MNTLSVVSVLLICAVMYCVSGAKREGRPGDGRGRGNSRHHPPSHRREGDPELLFDGVKVHLLRRGCGVAIMRDFGDVKVWGYFIIIF